MGVLQNEVILRESDHRYFDRQDVEFKSVSKFIEGFCEKFDRDGWSKFKAKQGGVSQAEILKDWDKKKDDSIDHGVRIHDSMETFGKTFSMKEGHEDLEPLVKSVFSDYKEYYRMLSEECLYTRNGNIAGTCDKFFVVRAGKNSPIDIEDFKTNLRKGIVFNNKYADGSNKDGKYKGYMLGPCSHLQDCNFVRYSIQLSIYGYMAEEMTGRKIRGLWMRYIPPENKLMHKRMAIPYMRDTVVNMIEWYKAGMCENVVMSAAPNFG